MKRKAVANKKMLVPMIQVLFKVICEMPNSEDVSLYPFSRSRVLGYSVGQWNRVIIQILNAVILESFKDWTSQCLEFE